MSKRFERHKRVGVQLTERDLETVEAVFEARYMTNQQVGRLLYNAQGSSYCRQRLRYLYDLGYLSKRASGPNDPDIYYLGPAGRRHIATQRGIEVEMVERAAGVSGAGAPAPALMMQHELTLSGLYVDARLQCREHGWEMAWKNTRALELEDLGMQPDARIEVTHGDKARSAFIEFTAVLPEGRELAGKIARYEHYWEATKQAIPVLWLTTSRRKANGIIAGVHRSEYKDYFLVGLIEDAGQFLTRRMWSWSEAEGMLQWLKPPQKRP